MVLCARLLLTATVATAASVVFLEKNAEKKAGVLLCVYMDNKKFSLDQKKKIKTAVPAVHIHVELLLPVPGAQCTWQRSLITRPPLAPSAW